MKCTRRCILVSVIITAILVTIVLSVTLALLLKPPTKSTATSMISSFVSFQLLQLCIEHYLVSTSVLRWNAIGITVAGMNATPGIGNTQLRGPADVVLARGKRRISDFGIFLGFLEFS